MSRNRFHSVAVTTLILVFTFSLKAFASSHNGSGHTKILDVGPKNVEEIENTSPRNTFSEQETPNYAHTSVNEYIEKDLKSNPQLFNISLEVQPLVRFPDRVFDPDDGEVISEVVQGFMRDSYGNFMLVGKPGRGKSHLLPMLALFFSYGVVPEEMEKTLQLNNPLLKLYYDTRLKHTQFIKLNSLLLSQDPTPDGQAFPNQEERMKQIIVGIFAAAKEDFNRKGIRTVFVSDEVATLPDLVTQALKEPLDRTGFKNPNDEFEKNLDTGIAAIGITTPWEVEVMIKGDGAIERRWKIYRWRDIKRERAFNLLVDKSDSLGKTFGGLEVEPEALNYLIQMNDFLNNPPQAMPASTNNALSDLFSWFAFNRSESGTKKKITLVDAQHWLIHKAGLSNHWLDGPNGEPPFYDLADYLKKGYKGHDELAEQIALPFEAWARFGGPAPVQMYGGLTAAGKNTIVRLLNEYIYKNNGEHQRYSIGASEGKALKELFEGEASSGSSPGSLPRIVQNDEDGSPPAILVLDEGKDAPSRVFSYLKVLFENRTIQPIGRDSRTRIWNRPIIALGQWGEELFEGKIDEEIAKMPPLTQMQIDEQFTKPKNVEKGYGVVPSSLLQRIKKSGGVFLIPPTPKSAYRDIVDLHAAEYIREQKAINNLDLEISPELRDEVVTFTNAAKEDPRVLSYYLNRLTHLALSKASEDGIPRTDASLFLTVDKTGVIVTKINGERRVSHINFNVLMGSSTGCSEVLSEIALKTGLVSSRITP